MVFILKSRHMSEEELHIYHPFKNSRKSKHHEAKEKERRETMIKIGYAQAHGSQVGQRRPWRRAARASF